MRAIGHTAHSRFDQIRNWFYATRTGRLVFRIGIGVLGLALVALGLLLVPLPGPGWLIVLAGFAVWAVEFAWARRLLHNARDLLHRWNVWIKRQPWYIRAPILLGILAVVAVIAWLSFRQLFGFDPIERLLGLLTRSQ